MLLLISDSFITAIFQLCEVQVSFTSSRFLWCDNGDHMWREPPDLWPLPGHALINSPELTVLAAVSLCLPVSVCVCVYKSLWILCVSSWIWKFHVIFLGYKGVCACLCVACGSSDCVTLCLCVCPAQWTTYLSADCLPTAVPNPAGLHNLTFNVDLHM